MLKFQALLAAGIGTALVAPQLGDDRVALLESALVETTRALDVLSGIEEMAKDGEPEAVGLIRTATEAPIMDARRRDDRLVLLRNEVSLLQTELDAILAIPMNLEPSDVPPVIAIDPLAITGATNGSGTGSGGVDAMRPLTTGLSEWMRTSLDNEVSDADVVNETINESVSTTEDATTTTQVTTELGGYSADPAGHARVCFRAGRYAEGTMVVPADSANAEALYWRARCLEKLERFDEALTDLKKASELAGPDTSVGDRSRNQITFLEWRLDFRRRGPSQGGQR